MTDSNAAAFGGQPRCAAVISGCLPESSLEMPEDALRRSAAILDVLAGRSMLEIRSDLDHAWELACAVSTPRMVLIHGPGVEPELPTDCLQQGPTLVAEPLPNSSPGSD